MAARYHGFSQCSRNERFPGRWEKHMTHVGHESLDSGKATFQYDFGNLLKAPSPPYRVRGRL